jgi:hypothetical protein
VGRSAVSRAGTQPLPCTAPLEAIAGTVDLSWLLYPDADALPLTAAQALLDEYRRLRVAFMSVDGR